MSWLYIPDSFFPNHRYFLQFSQIPTNVVLYILTYPIISPFLWTKISYHVNLFSVSFKSTTCKTVRCSSVFPQSFIFSIQNLPPDVHNHTFFLFLLFLKSRMISDICRQLLAKTVLFVYANTLPMFSLVRQPIVIFLPTYPISLTALPHDPPKSWSAILPHFYW